MKSYYVYILASRPRGALYIGVTSNLFRRLSEHREAEVESFTKQYGIGLLVYVEETTDIQSALHREKRLKKWNRDWKIRLIEKLNPMWRDLSKELV